MSGLWKSFDGSFISRALEDRQNLTWIWYTSIRDQFSEKDAKAPNIGLDGEFTIVSSFWSSPLNWETGSNTCFIFILLQKLKQLANSATSLPLLPQISIQLYLDEASKTKVCDFHYIAISNQDISCSQITMNIVLRFKICHASGYLSRHIYELRKFQRATFACKDSEREWSTSEKSITRETSKS